MSEQAGLHIDQAAPCSIAGIGVFRDADRFRACLQAEFGVAVPTTPCFVQAGPVTVSCLAPTRYLARAVRGSGLPARLTKSLAGLAAVTDQSDMWQTFTLAGPLTCELLARLLPIDVAPGTFPVGAVASTRAGHLDIRLWRVAEHGYEMTVSRSYTGDLVYLLNTHRRVLVGP